MNKKTISWAFYDWANSAFATTVMAGFFPIFFKQYWSDGVDVTESSFYLGAANSTASLLILVSAPILGTIADRSRSKKPLLFWFALLGILATGALATIGKGSWETAALVYVLAIVGFMGANIFYDSLLPSVATNDRVDRVSALGFSLGYLGGGLLFAVNVAMTLKPELFGLADASEAVKVSFVTVSVWWLLFSIPIFKNVPEPGDSQASLNFAAVRESFAKLATTFQRVKQFKHTFLFLIAFWLYIDGVGTIMRMAVDYGIALGFESSDLIAALLIVQFVGFPSAILFGWIGTRIGTKTGIYIGIFVYLCVTIWSTMMQSATEFYGMAVAIGLVQGGVQALSRSFYARLIPAGEEGEFFGFYNMMGKLASVFGPILMGATSMLTGDPRMSMIPIIILFVGGGLMLRKVDEQEGIRAAQARKF